MYQRQFVVETEQPSSVQERQLVLSRYREFMELNGYVSENRESSRGSSVTYKIRDARSRVMPTSRITDTIVIGLNSSGEILMELFRVSSYPPDDFSDKYIGEFVSLTEKFMSESSGKVVRIRLSTKK